MYAFYISVESSVQVTQVLEEGVLWDTVEWPCDWLGTSAYSHVDVGSIALGLYGCKSDVDFPMLVA